MLFRRDPGFFNGGSRSSLDGYSGIGGVYRVLFSVMQWEVEAGGGPLPVCRPGPLVSCWLEGPQRGPPGNPINPFSIRFLRVSFRSQATDAGRRSSGDDDQAIPQKGHIRDEMRSATSYVGRQQPVSGNYFSVASFFVSTNH